MQCLLRRLERWPKRSAPNLIGASLKLKQGNMDNPANNINRFFRGVGIVFITIIILLTLIILTSSCSVLVPHSKKDLPDQPTIWAVAEIKKLDPKYGYGYVFYKIIPINHGGINASAVWIVDYAGAFQVGDRVRFLTVPKDSKETKIQE